MSATTFDLGLQPANSHAHITANNMAIQGPAHDYSAAPGALAQAMASPMADLLNELDYGVALVRSNGQLVYMNKAARALVRSGTCMQLLNGALHAQHECDQGPLLQALREVAQRGLRRMLPVGPPDERSMVALVALRQTETGQAGLVAMMFARRQLCEPISVQWFARAYGLTQAESQVLELLCTGHGPGEIAKHKGVLMTTVRTQVNKIREKTGESSIRTLIQRVAMLPPLVCALKG